MKKRFLSLFALCLVCLLGVTNQAWGTETYHHTFSTKPNTGTNIALSSVNWNISATSLNSYNSGYAGVQFGTSKAVGSITLTSNSAWSYNGATVITAVRIWLNTGGGTVTPTVTIGGVSATSDGTTVSKKSSLSDDYTKANLVTFTPGTTKTGVVVIDVQKTPASGGAGYICAIEIDAEKASTPSVSITGAPSGIVIKDASVTLTASPSNLTPTGYQWYSNTEDDNTTGSEIVGATSSTYSPSTATAGTTYYYVKATDGTNNATSSTVAVVVENSIANTAETAYTTAEAIALIDAGSTQLTTTDVYVKGKVSKVDDNIVEGAITYWLDSDAFEVYKGKGLSGASFTDITDIAVGADVIICGKIKKFGQTYEFESGNYLASYTAPAKLTPTITASYKSKLYTNDEPDEYTVTRDGDGTLSVTSSETGVATASISGTTVTVTPQGVGTTTITIYVAETGDYFGNTKSYTLTVEEYVPSFTLDLSTDQTDLASENAMVWGNVVTTNVAKGSATTATNNYYPGTSGKSYTSTRFYSGSVLTFTPASGITISSITCTATSQSYASTLAGSTWTNATATAKTDAVPYTVTITPTDGTKPVSAIIGGTCGFTSIEIKYTGTASFTKTISSAKYATLGLPYAVTIPNDVSAYTASVEGSTVTMTKIATGTIPAKAGVVLYANVTENTDYNFVQTADVEAISGNRLVAVTADDGYTCSGDDVDKVYYLGVNEGNATFKKLSSGGTIGKNKAYLKLDAALSSSVKVVFIDDEATGIMTMTDMLNENQNGVTFNLAGQVVGSDYKGIVIKNGKKYINK